MFGIQTGDLPICSQTALRATGVAFYNQFIMDMSDYKTMPESLHGITEDIAADGLDDVLHELRSVGFDAFPLLCGANAFVGDGFSAILVFSDAGLHVGEQVA